MGKKRIENFLGCGKILRKISHMNPKYKRIVLKLSGEALKDTENGESLDTTILKKLALELKEVHSMGVQICLVVGGGNIFRGLKGAKSGVDRTTGDYMGMLATVINGLALMNALENEGVPVRVQTAIPMEKVAEPFILRRAVRHLEKGRIVIFVAGTGNPYFSTDTTAALRASEVGADCLFKATNVDGIYDKDPNKYDDAVRFDKISYLEAIEQRLAVMDSTAFSMCMDNKIPIVVFDMNRPGNIKKAIEGDHIGTVVS